MAEKGHLRMLKVGVMRLLSAQEYTQCGVVGCANRVALRCVLVLASLVWMLPNVQGQQLQIPQQLSPQQFHPATVYSGRPMQLLGNHSPNVQQLLKSEYRLQIEHRHSQLLITRSNVRRLAITDSGICNYVQYSPTELAVVGLQLGTTDLMIWFEGQALPAIYEITVVPDQSLEEQRLSDFSKLELRLKSLFPNSSVSLVPVGRQVIIKGQAYDSEEAVQILQIVGSEVHRAQRERGGYGWNSGQADGIQLASGQRRHSSPGEVINMLSVPGEFNIKMRVVIAEVSRSRVRELGVDWNSMFNRGRHGSGAALGGATGTTLSGIFENGDINVLLRWLATNKSATVLAEPTLVCMSGHAASLLAGGEFAVPTTIGLGGGQATSFRGVGTSLVVTPTVMDRDLIRLQIVPEFSAIDGANSVNGIPGTTVKRVQTTVELREGQTLALGGLISRKTSTTVSRIPLLGDIPFVGRRLFQSKKSGEDEVELLVLVTPEIVRPMEPDEVPPLPNFYVTHPNDQDLYKYGRTEGTPDTTVYQAQPFGTGGNHGVSAGYSLQGGHVLAGGGQSLQPLPEMQMPVRHFSGPSGPAGLPQPSPPPQQFGLPPKGTVSSAQPLPPTSVLPMSGSAISRITSAFRKTPKRVSQAGLQAVTTESRR